MVWTVGVDVLEELCCLCLALKTLRTFLDCPQNGKAVEKLGLILREVGISCSHGITVAFVPRGFRSCASIFEQSGDCDEIELVTRRRFLRRKSLLHQPHAAVSSADEGASQNGWLYFMAAPQ